MKSLADIIFFTPPHVGAQIDQFGEAGEIESGKAEPSVTARVNASTTIGAEEICRFPEGLQAHGTG